MNLLSSVKNYIESKLVSISRRKTTLKKTLQDRKRLPRVHIIGCRGVKLFLPKRLPKVVSEIELSEFEFWSFVRISVCEFCQNLSLSCHILRF